MRFGREYILFVSYISKCFSSAKPQFLLHLKGKKKNSFCRQYLQVPMAFLVAQMVKNLPATGGDVGSVPGLGRSPEEGNDNPLQYSCLDNPMDRGGACRTIVQGLTKELDTT